MNIKDFGGKWERVCFSQQKEKRIPKESGVYLLTNFSGEVLYVGVSINLRRRFCEHINSSKASLLTPQGKSFWFYYTLCYEKEYRALERGLLCQVELVEGRLPWFNQVRAPV